MDSVKHWRALLVLGTAQFLMVLDTSVMNVSISQLVEDFDTEVTAIQAVITLYALVMAAFMMIGGRFGDILGRRRMFLLGMAVYGTGSALTAVAPTLGVLALGWSVIEGLGAALVLPSMAALVAESYRGRDRAVAYGVIGGLAGAGIAVGPLLGGWMTTYLTWRLVFAGEVAVVVAVLLCRRVIPRTAPRDPRPRLDGVGATLSAAGLGLGVLGVLQSSTWGWVQPRNPPFTLLGFAPTLFVVGAGALVLAVFVHWERRRETRGTDALVDLSLLGRPVLRSGLLMLLSQNLILLGLFFTIPLYLQVVQGFDAFETGLRLLPVSVTMLAASLLASRLGRMAGPRRVVRLALVTSSPGPWPCWVWAWACSPRSWATSSSPASVRRSAVRRAGSSSRPRTWAPRWGPRSSGRCSSVPWRTLSPPRSRPTPDCPTRPADRPAWPWKPGSASCPRTRSARRPNGPGCRRPRPRRSRNRTRRPSSTG
jgi:MFS family permease